MKYTLISALSTALVLSSVSYAQQTTTPPAPTPVPVTSQTPAAPGQETPTAAPLGKGEMKAQKKTQKHEEKSAKESAAAQKANAKALKHSDKATDQAEKAQQPQ